jgi:hypothetical protein
MYDHNLTVAEVAAILNRKPQTVRIWRCDSKLRQIPEHTLKVLKISVTKTQAGS